MSFYFLIIVLWACGHHRTEKCKNFAIKKYEISQQPRLYFDFSFSVQSVYIHLCIPLATFSFPS